MMGMNINTYIYIYIYIYIQAAPPVLAPRNSDGLDWDELRILLTQDWQTPVYSASCLMWRWHRCCPFYMSRMAPSLGSSWRRHGLAAAPSIWGCGADMMKLMHVGSDELFSIRDKNIANVESQLERRTLQIANRPMSK